MVKIIPSLIELIRKHPFTAVKAVLFVLGLVFSLIWSDLKTEYSITVLFFLLTIITIVELKTGLILNKLTYPSIVLGISLSTAGGWDRFFGSLIGIAACSALFLIFHWLKPNDIGGGISKLAAMIGSFTGYKTGIMIVLVCTISGAIFAILYMLIKKKGRNNLIEYGPFLSFASILVIVLNLSGVNLWDYYMQLFAKNKPPVIFSTPVTQARESLLYTYDVEATTPEASGNLTFSLAVAPPDMNINSTTGLIQWTPSKDTIGEFNVTVKVCDSHNATTEQLFKIKVSHANSKPSADAGKSYTVNEGEAVTLTAAGTQDLDGNVVLYLWDLNGDGEYNEASGINVNTVFNNTGVYTIGLKVIDEYGDSDTDTAEVTVTSVHHK
jgi:prepilin signal peptidase PulO-like enzyme (type II secretory pathway)